jgi:putative Holliday junction resolvase
VLAVDFGERRIGLATSDATGRLATPRKTLRRHADDSAVEEILRFCREEEVGLVVLGLPRSLEGGESAYARRIRSFARKLAAGSALRVVFHEETLTSDEAARRRREAPRGSGGRARSVRGAGSRGSARGEPAAAGLDAVAAAVLLEDYLAARVSSK